MPKLVWPPAFDILEMSPLTTASTVSDKVLTSSHMVNAPHNTVIITAAPSIMYSGISRPLQKSGPRQSLRGQALP